jgi:hypothetical protein
MRPQSEILTDLIDFAQATISRPRSIAAALHDTFKEIAIEVRHADALPAEAERTTRAAMVMTIALEQFLNSDREPTSQWLGLAGVTLPLLRAEAWRALRNEKEARGRG